MSRSTQRPAAWHRRCSKSYRRPSVDCYIMSLPRRRATSTWHVIHLSLLNLPSTFKFLRLCEHWVQSVMSFLYSVFLFFSYAVWAMELWISCVRILRCSVDHKKAKHPPTDPLNH
jgi:hypothetical protein